MKLKKIISVIAALAVSSCFAISANAATEDQKLTVNPVISIDEDEYYIVDYELSYNGSLEMKKTTVSKFNYYKGSGIYSYALHINNIKEDDYIIDVSSTYQDASVNLDGNTLKITNYAGDTVAKVWSITDGENISLATIVTNYTTSQKTHNEIYNMFKNIGQSIIEVATITDDNVKGSEQISKQKHVTSYGITGDGNKYPDTHYKLNIATLANISGNTVSFDNEETSSIENGKQLVVLSQNLNSTDLTKDSKIAITYGDKTRESAETIFKLLGIEGEGTATGRTINVNVKTADTNSADGFSFQIK